MADDGAVDVEGTIRKWGNSFGFVVPVDVAREVGMKEGTRVRAHFEFVKERNDASKLPAMRFRPLDIDQAMEEAVAEELE